MKCRVLEFGAARNLMSYATTELNHVGVLAGFFVYECVYVSFFVLKPRCMRESYGSRVSVCYRASSYIPGLMSKVRRHTVSCRILKICIVWTSLKMFRSGDMALFACHNDR